MASKLELKFDDGDYKSRAYDFVVADDLYIFFKFESPKSDCEIGIGYDVYRCGGDWYVNDGTLDGCDYEIVNDIVWNAMPASPEFRVLDDTIEAAVRRFNGEE